ncbi:baculoviral IAP repeat-containing protein 7-B-like [Saccostrea echinata]|uniref:baculoviral IAP repeat-containing protein 7-B-like n=1 Tax=Saccostrea echinata TaxID=191078 RepID=UPI002A80A729|nr:baculoviral IAP repeat-containing protein 7-B-like [Saccostrea echinata]
MAGVDKEPDYLPVYPKYALLLKREATFDDRWPDSLKGLIPDLAKAGFYYRGVSDKTICFHCGMTLNLWEPTDDPYVEHAYWNPNCPYINTYEGREWVMNVFINHLLRAGYKPSPEIKPLLDQTSTEIQATGKCHICLERELQMALLPCGHVCCCSLCAPTFRYCPICRADVKRTQRIFLC